MDEQRKLRRPARGAVIAGVCAALADYFNLDPVAVRAGYVLLTVFTAFSGCLAYLIMWAIIPKENSYQ